MKKTSLGGRAFDQTRLIDVNLIDTSITPVALLTNQMVATMCLLYMIHTWCGRNVSPTEVEDKVDVSRM